MNIQDLIPVHKGDDRGIEHLKKRSFEEIQPIVPELLKWLQDVNWTIASDIAEILHPFVNRMVPEIIDIMKTDDGIWKYWILCTFGRNFKHPVYSPSNALSLFIFFDKMGEGRGGIGGHNACCNHQADSLGI